MTEQTEAMGKAIFADEGLLRLREDWPGIFDGEEWWVEQSYATHPRVDKVNRKLYVPPSQSLNSRSVVRHEMGHIFWSPDKPKTGSNQTIYMSLEEAIVNLKWKALGKPITWDEKMEPLLQPEKFQARYGTPDERVQALCQYLNWWGNQRPDGSEFAPAPSGPDKEFLETLRADLEKYVQGAVEGTVPAGEKARRAFVRRITDYYKTKMREEKQQPQEGPGQAAGEAGQGQESAAGNAEEPGDAKKAKAKENTELNKRIAGATRWVSDPANVHQTMGKLEAQEAKKANARVPRQAPKDRQRAQGTATRTKTSYTEKRVSASDISRNTETLVGSIPAGGEYSDTLWGAMEVVVPPLRVKMFGTEYSGRRRRAVDEGVDLVYPHRMMSDGRMFGLKNNMKRGGGTILIDWSGSMSLGVEHIEEIMAAAPRTTTVAFYSGNSGNSRYVENPKPPSGRLALVGKNGYRTDLNLAGLRAGAQNVVDLPALHWLAKQPRPRFWFSDGHVTGYNKATGRVCRVPEVACLEVLKHMKEARIIRLGNYAELLDVVNRRVSLHDGRFDDDAYGGGYTHIERKTLR